MTFQLELLCRRCEWSAVCDLNEVERRLRGSGALRRNANPSPGELRELFVAAAARWSCPACDRLGLRVERPLDDEVDWPEARVCAECRHAIPPERLEVFPQARLCATCQQLEESGQWQDEVDYCPRCGAPMALRRAPGPGVARYIMACTTWPHCRGTSTGRSGSA